MKQFFKKQSYDTDIDYLFFVVYIVILISLVAAYIFFHIIPPDWADIIGMCPLHKMTGLYCPGCGGTRAIKALLKLNLLQSAFYHPIPLYGGFLGILFMSGRVTARVTNGQINRFHAQTAFLWVALALIIFNCFYKNYCLIHYHIALIK